MPNLYKIAKYIFPVGWIDLMSTMQLAIVEKEWLLVEYQIVI